MERQMRIYNTKGGADDLPKAMVENATEHAWHDLPDWLQDSIRRASDELKLWEADTRPQE